MTIAREVLAMFRASRAARISSGAMGVLLLGAIGLGAQIVSAFDGSVHPDLGAQIATLIGVVGFAGSLLGAGAGVVASWTATRMQARQHQEAIGELRERVEGLTRLSGAISADVAALRGWIQGREGREP